MLLPDTPTPAVVPPPDAALLSFASRAGLLLPLLLPLLILSPLLMLVLELELGRFEWPLRWCVVMLGLEEVADAVS